MTEYVRQEIRAMVGARTGGAQGRQPPQQIQVAPGQQVSPAELEALGLTFEMPNTGMYITKCVCVLGKDIIPAPFSVQQFDQYVNMRNVF